MNKKQKAFHLFITIVMLIVTILLLCGCEEKTEYICEYEVQSTDKPIYIDYINDKGKQISIEANELKWNYIFKAKTGDILSVKCFNTETANLMSTIFVNNKPVAFKIVSSNEPDIELMYILP